MVNYIENYLAYRKDNADLLTYISDKSVLKVASKYFKNDDFVNAKYTIIESTLLQIAKDYSVDKSNRVRQKMQQVTDHMIRHDIGNIKHNIFKSIRNKPVPQSEKKPKYFFESHEDVPSEHHTITRLYHVAKTPQDKLLILLCSITGGRINEVHSMKWEDMNLKNPKEGYMRIKNSKENSGGKSVKDEYRLMDIKSNYVDKILELKAELGLTEEKLFSPNKSTEDRPWDHVITKGNGRQFSLGGLRKRYKKMWEDAYDKYKDHAEYPFLYERNPQGYTFQAFRRHYVCSYRESFGDDYTKAHHERLQLMVGHKVGSKVTDDIYTNFNNEKVVQKRMNSKINLGLDI